MDANLRTAQDKLGVRVFGAHTETDGYRVVDGSKTDFLGLAAGYRLTPNTTFQLHASAADTDGIPSQRSTYSFQIIPTDLNGDGVINNAIVNGVTESSARYNNTFLPHDYTSATEGTRFEQESRFLQLGVRHTFNAHFDLQYTFVRTTQELDDSFREYNTFNAANSSDVNHSADYNYNPDQRPDAERSRHLRHRFRRAPPAPRRPLHRRSQPEQHLRPPRAWARQRAGHSRRPDRQRPENPAFPDEERRALRRALLGGRRADS